MTHDWVKYRTIQHTGGGSIDIWMGDCINSPNNEKKSQLCLNTLSTCYRLNGEGKWLNARDFERGHGALVEWRDLNPTSTMEEIWYAAIRETTDDK